MAQEYHNYMTVYGPNDQRRLFLADAMKRCDQWGWDVVRVIFNNSTAAVGDPGRSLLDFYSHGFPAGLGDLMALHPDVTLEGGFIDTSAPASHHMKLKAGRVLEESHDLGEAPTPEGGADSWHDPATFDWYDAHDTDSDH